MTADCRPPTADYIRYPPGPDPLCRRYVPTGRHCLYNGRKCRFYYRALCDSRTCFWNLFRAKGTCQPLGRGSDRYGGDVFPFGDRSLFDFKRRSVCSDRRRFLGGARTVYRVGQSESVSNQAGRSSICGVRPAEPVRCIDF